MKAVTKPTPPPPVPAEAYARLFENTADGPVVLEDLIRRFGRSPYVPGGLEGDRATCYNAGRRALLDFILGRVNQAAGVNDPEPTED